MPSITIRVQFSEPGDVDQLFQLQRDLFPGEQMVQADQTSYALELDLDRSQYLMDQLALVPDLRGFEPYRVWDERRKDQMPLQFSAVG